MPHVLVIEDDPDILSSLAEVIRGEGCEVDTAANGDEALRALETREPNLIFLDLMMPVMSGGKFLDLARERFPTLRTPIVLLSAVHGLPQEAARLGIDRFLTKPFDLDDVVRLVHEYCFGTGLSSLR